MATEQSSTFEELYEHRAALLAAVMCGYQDISWIAPQHHDGTVVSGFAIAGMNLPTGQISYHLRMHPWWGVITRLGVPSLEYAPPWDGHTSQDVLDRLMRWLE
jgi:hypothetical protein